MGLLAGEDIIVAVKNESYIHSPRASTSCSLWRIARDRGMQEMQDKLFQIHHQRKGKQRPGPLKSWNSIGSISEERTWSCQVQARTRVLIASRTLLSIRQKPDIRNPSLRRRCIPQGNYQRDRRWNQDQTWVTMQMTLLTHWEQMLIRPMRP